jgi:hypothetical protein
VRQTGASNQIGMIIPLVVSFSVISGLTYVLLGKSSKVMESEKAQKIRIIGALILGIVIGFPFAQAVLMSPAYHQLMASII